MGGWLRVNLLKGVHCRRWKDLHELMVNVVSGRPQQALFPGLLLVAVLRAVQTAILIGMMAALTRPGRAAAHQPSAPGQARKYQMRRLLA
jgi:hypothetical protein